VKGTILGHMAQNDALEAVNGIAEMGQATLRASAAGTVDQNGSASRAAIPASGHAAPADRPPRELNIAHKSASGGACGRVEGGQSRPQAEGQTMRAEWAIEEFGGADLGDERRTNRLVEVGLISVRGPGPMAIQVLSGTS
jgi:hypothetical protein